MNQYIRKIFLFFLLAAILCSCIPVRPKVSESLETSFRELMLVDDINKSFQIYIDSTDRESMKFGSDIHVVIKNLSNQQIFFPVGYGIRLFIIRDSEWVEILNKNKYYGDGSFLRPKGIQELGDRISTGVRPILPSQIGFEDDQEILRIVMIGELMSDEEKTGIPVGAYTDIFVSR